MEQVMFDVYVAEATMETDYHNFDTPEKKEAYINQIFKSNNITQAVWDTSLSWYSDRIDLYLQINDSVKSRLKRVQTGIESELSQQNMLKIQSDEVFYSASYIPPVYQFNMPGNDRGGFRFRLDSKTLETDFEFEENRMDFSFAVIGIPHSFSLDMKSLITLEYGDTTIYKLTKITDNREYITQIDMYIDNDTLTEVRGFVNLQSKSSFIPNIQLYDISMGNMVEEVIIPETDNMDQLKMMETDE